MKRKAGFRNQAELRHIGGKNFMLLKNLVFYSEEYGREFSAPAGIITDLASIPWIAQSFCQVLGNNIRSAILHDFHCREEGKRANGVSQLMADRLFREGLAVDNVRWSKARIMFAGVALYQRTVYFLTPGKKYSALISN